MIRARLTEARLALSLLTRLPVGAVHDAPAMGRAFWAYPLAGLAVGGIVAAVLTLAASALPAMAAAWLALGAGWLSTGGLHEDGLADSADGLGGGATRARKLEIMRDSRIGSYGVMALIFAAGVKVALLSALTGVPGGWLALIGAAAFSRALLPVIMTRLPNARGQGLGAVAADGAQGALWAVLPAALVILLIPGGLAMLLAGSVAAALTAALAMRQISGWTGDILGAAQIAAELAMLAAAVAIMPGG